MKQDDGGPSEEQIAEALKFYSPGHHCDAYDDPAAAEYYGEVLVAAYRQAEKDLAEMTGKAEKLCQQNGELLMQAHAAKAEVERLRKALQEIASSDDDCNLTHEHPARCCIKEAFIAEHAKEALEKR